MKNRRRTAGIIIAVILMVFFVIVTGSFFCQEYVLGRTVTVGFIYDNDVTTPYSLSLYQAQEELHDTYKGRKKAITQRFTIKAYCAKRHLDS